MTEAEEVEFRLTKTIKNQTQVIENLRRELETAKHELHVVSETLQLWFKWCGWVAETGDMMARICQFIEDRGRDRQAPGS